MSKPIISRGALWGTVGLVGAAVVAAHIYWPLWKKHVLPLVGTELLINGAEGSSPNSPLRLDDCNEQQQILLLLRRAVKTALAEAEKKPSSGDLLDKTETVCPSENVLREQISIAQRALNEVKSMPVKPVQPVADFAGPAAVPQ